MCGWKDVLIVDGGIIALFHSFLHDIINLFPAEQLPLHAIKTAFLSIGCLSRSRKSLTGHARST